MPCKDNLYDITQDLNSLIHAISMPLPLCRLGGGRVPGIMVRRRPSSSPPWSSSTSLQSSSSSGGRSTRWESFAFLLVDFSDLSCDTHWRLKYTEVQSQQIAFTQSPPVSNNPKIPTYYLIFAVSCIMYHVSCIMYHVSCIMYHFMWS